MGEFSASDIYIKLEEYFKPELCTEVFPKIGVQHHNSDSIDKVYTATFASAQVFDYLRGINAHNSMLFTHHPVGQRRHPSDMPPALSEGNIQFMRERGINLFTYHIPLDKNGEYSPGNMLAKAIGVEPYEEFYFQNNVNMGVYCNSNFLDLVELSTALEKTLGHHVKYYDYSEGRVKNGRIAIMAGGAKSNSIYKEMRDKGICVFITGVTTKNAPWMKENHEQAKKYGVSIIGGTHLSTEKFAPMAMQGFFEKLGIPCEFIDESPVMEDM